MEYIPSGNCLKYNFLANSNRLKLWLLNMGIVNFAKVVFLIFAYLGFWFKVISSLVAKCVPFSIDCSKMFICCEISLLLKNEKGNVFLEDIEFE